MTEESADPISSPRWVEAMLSPAAHGVWRSLVARFVRDEEVVGSNPATPTIQWPPSQMAAASRWNHVDTSPARDLTSPDVVTL